MANIAEDDQGGARVLGHDIGPVLAEGEHSLPENASRPGCTSGAWRVVVQVREHLVSRQVCYKRELWFPDGNSAYSDARHPDEVIWPTWPATLAEEIATSTSPLAELQQHWDTATNRLRDSAKWMATVLGAALASVIPTAPLAGLGRHLSTASAALGACGLLFVSITLLLVLRVMRPESVSLDEVENAKEPVSGIRGMLYKFCDGHRWFRDALESPLYRWQNIIVRHPDLYLPCGVESLPTLRQLMIVEEITLVALTRARENARGSVHKMVSGAEAARAARLYELRAAAASIITVGEFYQVRARSTWATYAGVAFGLLGVLLIIAAVAWPIK